MWLSSREDGVGIGGGVVEGVMCLAVFGWCSRVISCFSWCWLRGLGVGVVEVGDERTSESRSSAQTISII